MGNRNTNTKTNINTNTNANRNKNTIGNQVAAFLHMLKPLRHLEKPPAVRGARSKQYRIAKQSVMRALATAYAGRKQRKRQMRRLWIARINAAARMNGLSYSRLMHGLKVAGVDINRKMLAEMAVNDAAGFTSVAEIAKGKLA